MELHEEKSILQLAAEIKALADSIRREPEECDHEWEHHPAEWERLSGRATVMQYAESYYCHKCDTWESELD